MIGYKGFASRKSFCCSGAETLFLGGREATTGNTSAVRRLEYGKPKTGKIKGRCQPLLSQMLASVVDTLAVFFLWLEIYRGL